MSGIVALIRIDGAPIEPALVQSLTSVLATRGPDAETVWCGGRAAFGHTLLRTRHESEDGREPLTLDGVTWIVSDARVDARDDLAAKLGAGAADALASTSDAELILRAYLKWGDVCLDHLLGDYAFAIWDSRAQRLFCARDHMGVKPLYYAQVGSWLVISNAVECVRNHPAVSDRLDDLAVADFLLFGFNRDPATTAFGDIRRLPAAHTLAWSKTGLNVRRYWALPIDEPVYYGRDEEYTERFAGLLRQSVTDRLRTKRVGVLMSGGIDSSALAAATVERLGPSAGSDSVRAFTFAYDSLIRDSEREYAAMTAAHAGIPICYYVMDGERGWPAPGGTGAPEPFAVVERGATERRCYGDMASHSRVAFYGEGPDNALLYEWRPYLSYLWRQRRWGQLLADSGSFLVHHKRVPLLGTIPRLIAARLDRDASEPAFPSWISRGLVRRLHLKDRWREANAPITSPHPVRPVAYASLSSPMWQSVFEAFEPSYTGVPLEVRHPYIDVRLLRFLFSVPVVPWCRQKHLLRSALRGVLPEAVLRRRKTPLSGSPDYERARRYGLPAPRPSERLAAYGAAEQASHAGLGTVADVEAYLRFVALSHWLYDLDAPHPQAQVR